MFPDKDWNWWNLSSNPNITFEWITSHPQPQCAWEWGAFCANPNLTMEILLNFLLPNWKKVVDEEPNDRYCWKDLSSNLGLNAQEIIDHYANCTLEQRAKFKWNWRIISGRKDVTLEMLSLSPNSVDSPALIAQSRDSRNYLDYHGASSNPNLTTEVVLAHPKLWDWIGIVRNDSVVPSKEMLDYSSYKAALNGYSYRHNDFSRISGHPLLPPELVWSNKNEPNSSFVLDVPNGVWNWSELSTNPAITIEMMLEHPECAWVWKFVSSNPNLTVEHLQSIALRGKEWNNRNLASNPNLPIDFLISRALSTTDTNDADKNWNESDDNYWIGLSEHPDLTAAIVIKYQDKPWNWQSISQNKFEMSKKLAQYHKLVNPTVWEILLSPDNSNCSHSRRLPSALANLTFQYFY